MKVVIDNNVIIDAVSSRQPFNQAAEKIVLLAGDEHFEGFITANSATDIYYVLKKISSSAQARAALSHLFNLFEVVSVSGEDCEKVLTLPMDDFEDALLAVCAKRIRADYIVSRDEVFLKADSGVPVISPADFLELISK